jgi:succinate-acetate transporter protein
MRATALLADITTRRIEKLTVILIILTTAIFLLGAAQLIALILK